MSTLSQFFGTTGTSGLSSSSTLNIFTTSNPAFTIPSTVTKIAYGVMGASSGPGILGPYTNPSPILMGVGLSFVNTTGAGGGFAWREEKVTLPAPVNLAITIGAGGPAASPTGGGATSISGPGITTITGNGGSSAVPTVGAPSPTSSIPSPIYSTGATITGGTASGGLINSTGGGGSLNVAPQYRPGFPSPVGQMATYGTISGYGGASAGGLWGPGQLAQPGGVGSNYSLIPSVPGGIFGQGGSPTEANRIYMGTSVGKTFFALVGNAGNLAGQGGANGTISYTPYTSPGPDALPQYYTGATTGGGGGLGGGGGAGLANLSASFVGRGGFGGAPGTGIYASATGLGSAPIPAESYYPGIGLPLPSGWFGVPTVPATPGMAVFEYWD